MIRIVVGGPGRCTPTSLLSRRTQPEELNHLAGTRALPGALTQLQPAATHWHRHPHAWQVPAHQKHDRKHAIGHARRNNTDVGKSGEAAVAVFGWARWAN